MRFFAFALLALIAISCVSAQSQAGNDSANKLQECFDKIQEPCSDSDRNCRDEYEKMGECQYKCDTDNASSKSDAMSCAKKCTSTNKDVQAWYDASLACLNSSSSMTSFVLTFAIALFALLF